jgi:1-acyl-sn-glycerol-3-phosphate acyltransferase
MTKDLGRKIEYYHSSWFRALSRVFYLAAIPVFFMWVCVLNGARIEGLQNLKGLNGAVTVCNHVQRQDSWLVASAFYPRKLMFPILPEKVGTLFPGVFYSLLGCISIPRAFGEANRFFRNLEMSLNEGRVVHFFPEGAINYYSKEIHEFKRGAFYLAAKAHVPIMPMSISFHEPKGLYILLRKKPVMRLVIGGPIVPSSSDAKEDERIRMETSYEQMVNMLD